MIMNSDIRLGVETFNQNGPYGCSTACLANVGRLLLNKEMTPDSVDADLDRSPEEDSLGYDRTLWLLRNGLQVHAFIDPECVILEEYLAGEATYDEIIIKFAARYYEGDIERATEDYGSAEYRQFVERLQARKPEHDAELQQYAEQGQYIEDLRPVKKADLDKALMAGSVVLIASGVKGSLGHQQLLFGETEDGEIYPQFYNPDEKHSLVFSADITAALGAGYIDPDVVYVVSGGSI